VEWQPCAGIVNTGSGPGPMARGGAAILFPLQPGPR